MANIVRQTPNSYYIVSKLPKPILDELTAYVGGQDKALREIRYRWETLTLQLLRELAERNLSGACAPPGQTDHAP